MKFILLGVAKGGRTKNILEEIREIDGVAGAVRVSGEYNFVVNFSAKNALSARPISLKIGRLEGVFLTKTLVEQPDEQSFA